MTRYRSCVDAIESSWWRIFIADVPDGAASVSAAEVRPLSYMTHEFIRTSSTQLKSL